MNDTSSWIERYQRDHTHPMNKATHMVGIPMIVISLPLVFLAPMPALALFVVGWILQFIGHAFEGKPPSFFSDPRFLIVGPLWYVQKLARKLTGKTEEETA
jgi:uncharacterized membrane protein YGL010W